MLRRPLHDQLRLGARCGLSQVNTANRLGPLPEPLRIVTGLGGQDLEDLLHVIRLEPDE